MALIEARFPQAFERQWESTLAEEPSLVHFRLKGIEDSMAKMASAFERLTLVEERHIEMRLALGRVDEAVKREAADHEARIRAVEKAIPENHLRDHDQIPTALLTSKWTISGILGVAAMVGFAALKVLLTHPFTVGVG
jgi:hypothetical protein